MPQPTNSVDDPLLRLVLVNSSALIFSRIYPQYVNYPITLNCVARGFVSRSGHLRIVISLIPYAFAISETR